MLVSCKVLYIVLEAVACIYAYGVSVVGHVDLIYFLV